MYRYFVKRVLDLICGIISLPFVLLTVLVLAPIIYFDDHGPVFYFAKRIGKNGRIFNMYKLRSMKVNAPDIRNTDGSTYNGKDDPRVTKIGKFMRRTSLDEFPQFLNVILGDMSVIGPRPNLPSDYSLLPEIEKKRLEVRPGITGYNQAYYRNSVPAEKKFKNDVYYINHLNFMMDLKIFGKTIASVLKHENINN